MNSFTDPKDELPKYYELFQPLLDALKRLGGSARPAEVESELEDQFDLSEEALSLTLKDGRSHFQNRIRWARQYLVKSGFLESSKRGVWTLSPKGQTAQINEEFGRKIIRQIKSESDEAVVTLPDSDKLNDDEIVPASTDYQETTLEILRRLSPAAFERLCQRLLRESGFEEVEVTGRSGDGGIDGNGLLKVNPFVSFRVLFQCKRYKGSVGSNAIRDFRGAMIGRADKGIIVTTGVFTREAQKEAVRDGATPIELEGVCECHLVGCEAFEHEVGHADLDERFTRFR